MITLLTFFMSSQNSLQAILLNLLSRKLTLVFYFINCRSGSVCLDVINQSWSPMFGNYQLSILILFLVKKDFNSCVGSFIGVFIHAFNVSEFIFSPSTIRICYNDHV